MLVKFKKWLSPCFSYLAAMLGKCILQSLLWTCRFEIEGLDHFYATARKHKCILMLWHNRLAVIPFLLSRHASEFHFSALISASRDGDILDRLVRSFKKGHTIRVPHLARFQALQKFIQTVESREQIIILTPDGPRGPRYKLKPGIAIAALETKAHVIALNWEASHFWEFNSWDRFRLPKPFSTIYATFAKASDFSSLSECTIEEARQMLQQTLPQN
jgi:hypothetical protein